MLKYEAIAQDIRHCIEDGTLAPNEKLPTVVELCALYRVSKITIRRAMDYLTEIGLITSRRGSGSYVKNASTLADDPLSIGIVDRAAGFTAEHSDFDEPVNSVVYDFEVVTPPERVAHLLAIKPDDFTYYHVRTRRLGDNPIAIEYTYMPLDVIPGLRRSHVNSSVYRYIRDELGLVFSSFHRVIRAVGATEEEAERLDCAVGEPLLEIEQVGFLDSGTPFEYSISRHVGTRFSLNTVTLA